MCAAEKFFMDLLTKQSSGKLSGDCSLDSGLDMHIAVAVLKACQVQTSIFRQEDGLDDEKLKSAGWLAGYINANCTQNHNLNHILMNNVRASLEKQCIGVLIIKLIKCIKINFVFSYQSDQQKTAGSSVAC